MSDTTSPEQRAGVLACVITGGRPELRHRPTAKFLPALRAAGVQDVLWVVSDQDAPAYELDEHPLCVYPRAWAEEYAAAHWMQPQPPQPGAFLGAFPGREWACQEAERRGCWAVLQLDDNVDGLSFLRRSALDFVAERGGLGLVADLLAGVALSTNARMVGAQLASVAPSSRQARQVARAGFPYSVFLERVGPGREEWFGPFEDDITHALQYGSRPDGATAAVMPSVHYHKENKHRSGMRAHYGDTRAVQLQRLFPEAAKVNVRATRSNGRGEPRVFHTMPPGAIRNPLVIRDRALYGAVRDRLSALVVEKMEAERQVIREKVARRAQQAEKMREKRLRGTRSPSATVPAPDVQLPTEAEVAAAADPGRLPS
jgi:hypothetical protein